MNTHFRSLLLAGLVTAAASGTAFAGGGDNGMNPFYGDSWAALEGHGTNLTGAATLPGADAAHAATEPSSMRSLTDRMSHAEAAMADRWHQATASMSERMESPPLHVSQPLAATPTDPFDDKAGN